MLRGPFAIAWLISCFVGDVSQYDRVQVLPWWVLVRELTLIEPMFVVYSFFVTVAESLMMRLIRIFFLITAVGRYRRRR